MLAMHLLNHLLSPITVLLIILFIIIIYYYVHAHGVYMEVAACGVQRTVSWNWLFLPSLHGSQALVNLVTKLVWPAPLPSVPSHPVYQLK